MNIRLFLICVVLSTPAFGGTATFSCTPPTQFVSGDPIEEPLTYNFYWSTDGSQSYNEAFIGATECEYTTPDYPTGTEIRMVATANCTVTVCSESDWSNEASKVIDPGEVTNPPDNLTTVGTVSAYGIAQSDNFITAYPVGTVPGDVECNALVSITTEARGTLYQVDKDLVDYPDVPSPVKPPVVFALCNGSGT